jgi:putative phage-type endonuclease
MAIHPIPATREEWLKLRKDYVGASEVAALLGVQADYQLSPLALYLVKSGQIAAPEISGERIDWGNEFEDAIARKACREENWRLFPGVFATDDEISGSSATLDRVVMPSADDEAKGYVGPGALECKNVDFLAHRDKWDGGEPPNWILIQLQDQLACSGYQWGAVSACIAGNTYFCRRYRRNETIIAAIRQVKTNFWAAVKEGRPPPADHYESTGVALGKLYPRPVYDLVDLTQDNELPSLVDQAIDLAARRKAVLDEEERVKNLIRQKLGPNKKAKVAGGRTITRSVAEDTPDRPANPGEIIRGRKGSDRLTCKGPKDKKEAA